jgi:hypothetical protein
MAPVFFSHQRGQKRLPVLEEPVEAGARQIELLCQRLDLHRLHARFQQRLKRRIQPQVGRAAPAGFRRDAGFARDVSVLFHPANLADGAGPSKKTTLMH